MVDITEISAVVAAAGVLVGVVYYILDLRHQTRIRRTDLFLRLYSIMQSKDYQEAWEKISGLKADDVIKMMGEHRIVEINQILSIFEETGILLQMKLLEINMVEKMLGGNVIRTWELMRPAFENVRKVRNDPKIAEGFEYLYNEVKKREDRLNAKKG